MVVRLRGHKQKKLNDRVHLFLWFVSPGLHYQAEFKYISKVAYNLYKHFLSLFLNLRLCPGARLLTVCKFDEGHATRHGHGTVYSPPLLLVHTAPCSCLQIKGLSEERAVPVVYHETICFIVYGQQCKMSQLLKLPIYSGATIFISHIADSYL